MHQCVIIIINMCIFFLATTSASGAVSEIGTPPSAKELTVEEGPPIDHGHQSGLRAEFMTTTTNMLMEKKKKKKTTKEKEKEIAPSRVDGDGGDHTVPSQAPTYLTDVPTYLTSAPTFLTATPTYLTPAPTFLTPTPTFQTATPTFQTATPTFLTPTPTFVTSAPTSLLDAAGSVTCRFNNKKFGRAAKGGHSERKI